jgi:hypothetical protein
MLRNVSVIVSTSPYSPFWVRRPFKLIRADELEAEAYRMGVRVWW